MKLSFLLFVPVLLFSQTWIRINQLGYQPNAVKAAVVVSTIHHSMEKNFVLKDALTDEIVFTSHDITSFGEYGAFTTTFRLDFSECAKSGAYYIQYGKTKSPRFRIADDVYDGAADFLLRYMRQQRSGYNPFLRDSCHTSDGFIIYHPTLDSTHIDVSGGWHDASDYLQYVTTSATATYQLMFAYEQHPSAFGDEFLANGLPGKNGIPDVLDEAKWGLDWLMKMNPDSAVMFNQIADDRDHRGFRLPTEDTVFYGKGKERPVYFVSGKPQGIYQYKNRTTGVASTAGKFASCFAAGARIFKNYYPAFSYLIEQKAYDAYEFGKSLPGVCQTAPCRAPYFYEEDNWVDDMELAATELYQLSKNEKYLNEAAIFGNQEPIVPWQGADTAKHYQWYPFINLGHYNIYKSQNNKTIADEFLWHLEQGVRNVYRKGKTNPFLFGIPFIWCSNNLVSSMATQTHLIQQGVNDPRIREMEAALRDWLFGCNPWGTSMIVGLPKNGISPKDPHSAFSHVYGYSIDGGLIDGPVYASIFKAHEKYIKLYKEDVFAPFQSLLATYHDDWGDYTSNEPTMDGTAGLTMYLSTLDNSAKQKIEVTNHGGIIRFDTTKKEIYLVFTGHEFADGASTILSTLKKHKIKASFFFTGDFYRNKKFARALKQLIKDGHYVGGHSNKHLLYASWEKRDSTLVTQQEFENDLRANYTAMKGFGITKEDAKYFLPPYEWYNDSIAAWTKAIGVQLVNFSPGTYSNADYTTPDMKNYLSSDSIYTRILRHEEYSASGLNGFLLLTHFGVDKKRKDTFYLKLDKLITELKQRGYSFKRL